MIEIKRKEEKHDVLLIEDNDDDILLTELAIKQSNINANLIVKRNGRDGIEFIKSFVSQNKKLPDIIMLDINLPILTGIEVLKKIKSEQVTSLIPIIIFTSSDAESDMNHAYENGADLYIRKPDNLNGFKRIMQVVIRQIKN